MTEDEKRTFSAWESLRDHAWREFEDKSRAEWRLSFGIWAAVLASASALIASGKPSVGNLVNQLPSCTFIFFSFFIVLGHIGFLYWIQTKLQDTRKILTEAQDEMRKLLSASKQDSEERSICKQVPMYVEASITSLLLAVLYVVLKHS